jgi:hypothetical protein
MYLRRPRNRIPVGRAAEGNAFGMSIFEADTSDCLLKRE